MNPLLNVVKTALENNPRSRRPSRVVRKRMSRNMAYALTGCLCLAIVVAVQLCSHHHIGFMTSKRSLSR